MCRVFVGLVPHPDFVKFASAFQPRSFAVHKIPNILRDHLYQPFASLDARPCDVRRDDDVAAIFHAQKRMVRLHRLCLQHVKRRAQASLVHGASQRLLIYDAAAAEIHQNRPLFHLCKLRLADQSRRFFI